MVLTRRVPLRDGRMGGFVIIGVQDIYYNVTNPKRAIKFYTEGPGIRLMEESDGVKARPQPVVQAVAFSGPQVRLGTPTRCEDNLRSFHEDRCSA